MTKYLNYIRGGELLLAPSLHYEEQYTLKCYECKEYYDHLETFVKHCTSHYNRETNEDVLPLQEVHDDDANEAQDTKEATIKYENIAEDVEMDPLNSVELDPNCASGSRRRTVKVEHNADSDCEDDVHDDDYETEDDLSDVADESSSENMESNVEATTNDSGRTDVSHNRNNSTIKKNIMNAKFKIVNKRGRSKVWEVFGKVTDETGQEMSKIVACRKCFNIYKYERSTSNLVKHRCYLMTTSIGTKILVDEDSKKNALSVLTKWSVENCRPFKISADSGFRNVAEFLMEIGSKYGPNVDIKNLLPHPTTISQNIESLYTKLFGELKSEIVSVKDSGFALTTDLWTDNYLRKSFLSITIHFVKEGQLLTRLLGFTSMEGEKCTHTKIRYTVEDLLSEYDCTLNDKVIIVTDRGANMIAAFQNCNKIHCISHLIHNTVEKSIHGVSEISVLCQLCTKLVRYIKKSGANNALKTTLKSFSPTRWNTIFYLLQSIEKNWSDIIQVLQEKGELHRIDGINLQVVSALVEVLQHFEKASKLLEEEQYPTMDIAFAHIHLLKKKSLSKDNDAGVIKQFKDTLAMNIQNEVVENLTVFHKVGLYLYPPANKLIYFHEDEKQEIISECKRQMKTYDVDFCGEVSQSPPHNVTSSVNLEALEDFVGQSNIFELTDRVSVEIRLYSNLNVVLNDDFNVLLWWDLHKNEFPLLYKKTKKQRVKSGSFVRSFTKSNENMTAFISAYKSQPKLWNRTITHIGTQERHRVLQEIITELKTRMNLELSYAQVSAVITHLRYTYKVKLKGRQKKQNVAKQWYLEELGFLRPFIESNLLSTLDSFQPELAGEHLTKILDIYKNHPILWNSDLIENCCENKREEALEGMINAVESDMGLKVKTTTLKEYIEAIRDCITKDKYNEMGNKDTKVRPKYYNEMKFLHDHIGPFKCSECDRKLKNPLLFKIHKSEHDGSIPLICSLCNKEFKVIGSYTDHARRHMKDLKVGCKECGKRFLNAYNLMIHMRSHTGANPFCCEICGSSFRHIQSYATHKRRHEKKYLHSCPVCSKGFYKKVELSDHLRSHYNVRDFVCKTCGKAFKTRKTLAQHEVIHDDARRHACNICGKAFKLKIGVSQHMKTHGNLWTQMIEK